MIEIRGGALNMNILLMLLEFTKMLFFQMSALSFNGEKKVGGECVMI